MKNSPNLYAVWSEFTPYEKLHSQLNLLKQNGCSLYLAVHAATFRQSELYTLLKYARDLGIEVRPWLLLEKSQGYWPNKWNLEVYSQFVSDFNQECINHGVPPEWIILDLEPHIQLLLELEQLLQKRQWLQARKLILKWGSEVSWETGSKEMQKLVDKIHGLGLKVQVVTMPMVLDDMKSGKHKLQHWLGIPVEGIAWDEMTFMTYRPYFWDYLPKVTSQIISSYAKDARAFFGDKASLALGPVGSPGVTQSKHFYSHPGDCNDDIQAGVRQGINRFSLFCLEGILEQGKLEDYLKPQIEKTESSFDFRAEVVRVAVKAGLLALPGQI